MIIILVISIFLFLFFKGILSLFFWHIFLWCSRALYHLYNCYVIVSNKMKLGFEGFGENKRFILGERNFVVVTVFHWRLSESEKFYGFTVASVSQTAGINYGRPVRHSA